MKCGEAYTSTWMSLWVASSSAFPLPRLERSSSGLGPERYIVLRLGRGRILALTPLLSRSATATKKSCLQTTSLRPVSNISQSNLRISVATAKYNSAYARLQVVLVVPEDRLAVMI